MVSCKSYILKEIFNFWDRILNKFLNQFFELKKDNSENFIFLISKVYFTKILKDKYLKIVCMNFID